MFYSKKSGTVLIFTLLILSVILILTQQLVRSVLVGTTFDKTMIQKEQAQVLALSGINLAIAQLTEKQPVDKSSVQTAPTQGIKADPNENTKRWLAKILPNLNRWQTFELKEDFDGIDGKVKICISSENGKININNAFDFKKGEFKKDYDFLLKGLEIKGKLPAGQIYNKLSEFFKKRDRKFDDITEILNVSDLDVLNIFYEPPRDPMPKKRSQENTEISLQDLFTIWTEGEKIEPLFLSDSMCAVLNIRRPLADDADKLKDNFAKVVEAFKKDLGKNWDASWDFLLPIYEKKPKFLDNIKNILSQEFGPKVYSVISCGIVGDVQSKLLAILKLEKKTESKNKQENKTKPPQQTSANEKAVQETSKEQFKVIRIYWL
ncbi:MAG: hypothetical protein ABIA74_05755 [bacterium]